MIEDEKMEQGHSMEQDHSMEQSHSMEPNHSMEQNHSKKMKERETELFHLGLIFLAVGIVLWAVYDFVLRQFLPDIPCFFLAALDMYCPGCGGTRALRAFLQGRILLSLWYHPLILYTVIVGGGFLVTQGLHRIGLKGIAGWRFHNWYLYGALILVAGNFIIKNILYRMLGISM